MDGMEVCRKLRNEAGKNTPVLTNPHGGVATGPSGI